MHILLSDSRCLCVPKVFYLHCIRIDALFGGLGLVFIRYEPPHREQEVADSLRSLDALSSTPEEAPRRQNTVNTTITSKTNSKWTTNETANLKA